MANEQESGNFMFAFLSGALLGAGVALLFAPQKGDEARDRLRDYAQKTRENLGQWSGEAKDRLNRVAEKGREVAQKGREIAEKQGAAVNDALKAGREAMHSERDRLGGETHS